MSVVSWTSGAEADRVLSDPGASLWWCSHGSDEAAPGEKMCVKR